jgi:hypothetical protein
MKHIQSYYIITFNFEELSLYKIYGSYTILINMLKKMNHDDIFENIIVHMIDERKKREYTDTIGIFLIKNYFSFTYYPFNNKKNEKNIIKDYKRLFKYKGEIKIENNKIILDTLEADIEKYNI